MEIVNNVITMTRGDSETITVSSAYKDGVAVPFAEGDKIYFTVKKKDTDIEKLLQKVITDFVDGKAVIEIDPIDTSTMVKGTYIYDVQLIRANGRKTTIILPNDFVLTREVTYE